MSRSPAASVSHNLQAGIRGDDPNQLLLIVKKHEPIAVFSLEVKGVAFDLLALNRNLLAIFEINRDLLCKVLRRHQHAKLLWSGAAFQAFWLGRAVGGEIAPHQDLAVQEKI